MKHDSSPYGLESQGHVASTILVNSDSCDGLLPGSTKSYVNQQWLNICEILLYSFQGNIYLLKISVPRL